MTATVPLRVDAVSAWAEELPFANKPLVARETYALIERLQQSGLSARRQLQILRIIRRPATLVLEHIRQRLMLGNNEAEQFLPLGDRFCERLTAACESVLISEDKARGRRLFGLRTNLSADALALASHFMEQWYMLRVVSHRPVPQSFWTMAREHAEHPSKAARASIARLLALHLADPPSLTPRQLQSLADMLHALPMEKLVTIRAVTVTGPTRMACVWAKGDHAPKFDRITNGDNLYIDFTNLLANLRADTNKPIAPALLATLIQRWDGERPERQHRTQTGRPIMTQVVIGLRGVLRHLSERDASNPETTQLQPEILELSADGDAFNRVSNTFARRSRAIQGRFFDLSDGGCRLQVKWDTVQNGDIIAVHWGHTEWRIGNLTWISRLEDAWECGVQWLLDAPKVSMVRFEVGKPVIALRGHCHADGEPALIYGSGGQAAHRHCRINLDDQWQQHSLTTIKSTGLVELAGLATTPQNAIGLAGFEASQPIPPANADEIIDDASWGAFAAIGAAPIPPSVRHG